MYVSKVSESRGGAVYKAGEAAGYGEVVGRQEERREAPLLFTQMTRQVWSSLTSVKPTGKWAEVLTPQDKWQG